MKGEKLEMLRRRSCNFPVINNFFSMLETVLRNIDPKYVFNADETGLSAKKSFKILTDNKNIHVTSSDLASQHISAMCCYSAIGHKLPILFIFANREKPLEELADVPVIYIASAITNLFK